MRAGGAQLNAIGKKLSEIMIDPSRMSKFRYNLQNLNTHQVGMPESNKYSIKFPFYSPSTSNCATPYLCTQSNIKLKTTEYR